MIGVDTNVLVYARRAETAHHEAALKLISDLAEGDKPWALFWPCIYEFLRVVTHPRVFDPPTAIAAGVHAIEQLLLSPSVVVLPEGGAHFAHFRRLATEGIDGNLVHDAHIAALAIEHGVTEFLTADRDFARFRELHTRNPFAG